MNKQLKKNIEAKVGSFTVISLMIISAVVAVLLVNPGGNVSALEDFTGYTAYNATAWTIASSNVSGASIPNTDSARIYRDMGSANMTDFNISFIYGVTASSGTAPNPGGFSISNTFSNWIKAYDNYYSTIFVQYRSGVSVLRLMDTSTHNGSGHNYDSVTISKPFRKYFILTRSGTTATLKIYNDASHTSLFDTLSITCNENASRYLYAHQGYEHPASSDHQTQYVSNIVVNSYGTPVTPVITISNPNPPNANTGTALETRCTAKVSSSTAGAMNITFATNESGGWTNVQSNASVANNGFVNWTFTDADAFSTRYYWRVYAQCGVTNSSQTYYFTTQTVGGTYQIAGLPDDEFTWTGYNGTTVWANDTTDGTNNETLRIYTNSTTDEITDIFLDFTNFDSTLYYTNLSIEVINGTDGSWDGTTHQITDAGGNVTLNSAMWAGAGWCHGTNPFPIQNTDGILLVRLKITFPTTAVPATCVNLSAWKVTWKINT